jgi:hypothetical protein
MSQRLSWALAVRAVEGSALVDVRRAIARPGVVQPMCRTLVDPVPPLLLESVYSHTIEKSVRRSMTAQRWEEVPDQIVLVWNRAWREGARHTEMHDVGLIADPSPYTLRSHTCSTIVWEQ